MRGFKFDWVVVEKVVRKPPASRAESFEGAELVAADPPQTTVQRMTAAEAYEESLSAKVAATLVNMPISLIEPAQSSKADRSPSDLPWGLTDIGVQQSQSRGEGTVVAVLDTGIDAQHEAFRGLNIVPRNFTGVGEQEDVTDDSDSGHGTHCAGTIFGGEVEGVRIGVAPGVAKALIGKVFSKASGGDTRTLVSALQWAQLNGADVVSMSLGMDFPGFIQQLMDEHKLELRHAAAITLEAYRLNLERFNKLSESVIGVRGLDDGTLVVGAAGNESQFPNYRISASLPSNALQFVSVAALSPPAAGVYSLAPFSNGGAKLGAPGVQILSARPGGGLATMDGTSMAAPHVAGVACLWLQKLRSVGAPASTLDVVDKLQISARPLLPSVRPDEVRWGRVVAPA